MSALTPHIALVPDSPSVTLADISPVASAIQKQVARDFGPIWAINATVDAFEKLEAVPIDYWWIIVCDDLHPGGGGFHLDDHGQPIALVQADPGWELAASHEALEMLADPSGNRTIAGDPRLRCLNPSADAQSALNRVGGLALSSSGTNNSSEKIVWNGIAFAIGAAYIILSLLKWKQQQDRVNGEAVAWIVAVLLSLSSIGGLMGAVGSSRTSSSGGNTSSVTLDQQSPKDADVNPFQESPAAVISSSSAPFWPKRFL